MGSSPSLRIKLIAVVLAVIFTVAAGAGAASAANTGTAEEARSTAAAFLDALGRSDADALCALFTPEAVGHLGGPERCKAAFSESEDEQDFGALETLLRAYTAAHNSAAKRKGRYVTKHFTRRDLARDMERRDPELTVKLGRGPTAAAGQLATTVILDRRSTARRIVLYAESDDGTIFRMTASARGRPSWDEVAVGIPEAPQAEPPAPQFSATVDSVTLDASGTAYARGTFVINFRGETYTYAVILVLVPGGDGYLVDDFFISVLTEP